MKIVFFRRWFLYTVKVYSPIVLIQLISSMIMLSTTAFYLDLVRSVYICTNHKTNYSDQSLSLYHPLPLSLNFDRISRQQQLKDPDFGILIVLCLTTLALGNLFIYCYFGKISTDSFANMSDFVYSKVKWYILPSKLQKYVILMIGNMDRPLFYHGFQVAVVDLNTFVIVRITI